MRDLTIHGDDLIVGTHGRSFWILDDLTPLRQLNDEIAKSPAYLFAPQEALRWRWNRNPDTPLPPETPAGQNPPDGAILDYYLASAAHGPVVLEILDSTGASVRRYSSTDAPLDIDKIAGQYPIPMYWVRPSQTLSAAAGMHRFVWDLRHAPPRALNTEFPISAILHNTPLLPLGSWVLPGNYTARLTVDGKEFTKSFAVKMDPRIKSSLADLQAQASLESGAVAGMDQSYDALTQVQSIRAQIKEVAPRAKGKLRESLESLDRQCAELAGATVSTFYGTPSSGKETENFSTINQHFGQLLAIADSADAAPTTQASQVYASLSEQMNDLARRWQERTQTAIPGLNQQLQKAGLSSLDPQQATRASPRWRWRRGR